MPYATQADLVPTRITAKQLAELTSEVPGGPVVVAIVTADLEEASGTVDSYCRSRYATPLQPSDVIKARTLDIATYLLFSRRDKATERLRQRYEDAISFLKSVSSGAAQLDQPVNAAPQSSSGGPALSTKQPTFSDSNLRGFK